jgi:hypothetical protein
MTSARVIAITSELPKVESIGRTFKIRNSMGGVEHIGTFGSESTARDWVEWDAPKFFRETSQR